LSRHDTRDASPDQETPRAPHGPGRQEGSRSVRGSGGGTRPPPWKRTAAGNRASAAHRRAGPPVSALRGQREGSVSFASRGVSA
jgi:hypothetical protein